MKTLNKLLAMGAIAFSLMLATPHKTMAQDDGYVSDQEFYDDLQPYGTWVQDDTYGDVWVPNVDGDFRPYATDGYWAQTDYGTTWVSDYPWGWATFHYGRWRYDDYYGWEWIPGHEWGPAWVSWRQGGGYYGWAPMGPGISVTLSLGSSYNVPDDYWVCVPQAYITNPRIYNYYVPHSRISFVIRRTAYLHNTYARNKRTYIAGPRPADIQKITHHKVTVYKINNAGRAGTMQVQKNTINLYRPAIKKSADARPARVVNAQAYRQQNPSGGIGKKGSHVYNQENASKLATVAHSAAPNTTVVHVNPGHGKQQQPAQGQPAHPTNGGHHATSLVGNAPAAPQAGSNPAQPAAGGKGRHQHTAPTANPAAPVSQSAQPQNGNAPAPQSAPTTGKGRHQHTAPAANPAAPVVQPTQPQDNPAQPAPAAGSGRARHQHTAPAVNPVAPVAQPAPAQDNNNPAQNAPAPAANGRHQHKTAPAVMPPAQQHNADQPAPQQQQDQQAKVQAQQARAQARAQAQQAQQQAQQQQKQQAPRQQPQQQQQQAQQQIQAQQQRQQQIQAQQARAQARAAKQQQQQQKKDDQKPPR